MKINEFVSETIKQIIDGVQEAQKYVSDENIETKINPRYPISRVIKSIDFDVAVTTSESNKKGKDGGIKVANILNIGGNTNTTNKIENISRIKFSIDIELPHQINDDIRKDQLRVGKNESKNSY